VIQGSDRNSENSGSSDHAFTYIESVRSSLKYLFQQRIFGTQFFFERMMDEKLSPIHRIPFDHIGCSKMVEIVK